jgi:hypothetical protein
MSLLAGCRVAVAPKFHLNADWSSRIAIGAGVEESDGHFFFRGPWRSPTSAELALLVAASEPQPAPPGVLPLLDDPATPPVHTRAPDDCISLFQFPAHLQNAWWKLVEASAESGAPMQGFDGFAASVTEFLNFKQLGVSASTQMEVLMTAAGERSIRVDPGTGRPSGLGSTVAPWAACSSPGIAAVPRLHAVVNLGEEPTGVVVINLALSSLATELARCAPTEPPPATVGELVARFLRARPDYPPVRLQLGAGEGCRLPACGLILDADATGKEEPSVLLLISEGRSE